MGRPVGDPIGTAGELSVRLRIRARKLIMIASLRYHDDFAKVDGQWYFAERKLILDWSETRAIAPA